MNKLPPIEKIYEAYSAVADGRVELHEEEAFVASSSRDKQYIVVWDGDIYSSNDNATYWQGYAGYPVLAVLLLQGYLPLDAADAQYFAGIGWNGINARHKGNYAEAAGEVLERLRKEGAPIDRIQTGVQAVYKELKELDIEIRRGKNRPPKSNSREQA